MAPSRFRYTSPTGQAVESFNVDADWPAEESSPSPTTSTIEESEIPAMPARHFLSLARNPSLMVQHLPSESPTTRTANATTIDTSTVAAADFDVDPTSGFMPPRSPIVLLQGKLALWEALMQSAMDDGALTLGAQVTSPAEADRSAEWRRRVESIPVLTVDSIRNSEVLLRRAHHVLTFVLHFYIHSQPPLQFTFGTPPPPHRIPPCLSIPLIQLAHELVLPPILTYSDNVLYNWELTDPTAPLSHTNVSMVSTFSLTESERHFYLTSARIELRGVEALDLMRSCMDEAFIGDELSLRRIANFLRRLSHVIDDMAVLLLAVRDACDPDEFYNRIRPWFRGYETGGREWLFEGVDEADQRKFARVSGPSAGQSSLIHALDVFLGVDHTSRPGQGGSSSHQSDPTFLMKMEQYMPRHHRAFLQHLRGVNQNHVRTLVSSSAATNPKLRAAYDEAVMALKKFRDGHIRIATLYIVSQARKAAAAGADGVVVPPQTVLGTGGTNLVPFLKEARDNTAKTAIGTGH